MSFDSNSGNITLANFLQIWPLSALHRMTLEQYANLSDHNSFCYWLEYGSKDVGEIGGMPLTKFGIWKYKNEKDLPDTYLSDNTYAWSKKFGSTRAEAFSNIIVIVVAIATAATVGDWNKIEEIEFHSAAKWKIAFLYSEKKIAPIYTREGLLKIAVGLGRRFPENAPILQLQEFIAGSKPVEKDMLDYAGELWDHYVRGKPFRNYFIVGSKYQDSDGNNNDVFPTMLETNSIAIGFLAKHDLTALIGASDEVINAYIEEYGSNEGISVSKIQSYFLILLNLKPGDIVAVKSHGYHGTLKIIAYAVVTEKNNKVYEYKPDVLGHHINVEFVELGINRSTGLNYAGSIHHVSSEKIDHLKQIFGPFLQVDDIALGSETEDQGDSAENQKYKSEESYQRGAIAARMVKQLHSIIQNSFYRELKKKYPGQFIQMEFGGRIDIIRESATERWFYEIKPFENIISCLREATGQLLEYAFRFQNAEKHTNLVVVGPGS